MCVDYTEMYFIEEEISSGFCQKQIQHEAQRGFQENEQAKDHDNLLKDLETTLSQYSSETNLEVGFYLGLFVYCSTFLHRFCLRNHCYSEGESSSDVSGKICEGKLSNRQIVPNKIRPLD